MQSDSIELSLLSIFSFLSFFTFFTIQKISNKIFGGSLSDDDFNKPQAFHSDNIPRSGGLAAIISFLIFIFLNNILFSHLYLDYLVLGTGLFLIGFLEDIKIKLSPKLRLILMTIFLFGCVKIFQYKFLNRLLFLNKILSLKIFIFFCCSLFFIYYQWIKFN